MTDTTSTNLRQEAMRILVETELPICEECGNGTFSWDEAQRDPSIMEQKAFTADRSIALFREAMLSDRAVKAAIGEMTAHDQQLLHEWTDDGGIVAVRPILAAALDAITSGGDDDDA